MKPFNLELAKAGDPICNAYGTKLFFVGVKRNGDIVVESSTETHEMHPTYLYMTPNTRTVWVNLYVNEIFKNEDAARMYSRGDRIGNKAYKIEVEE